MSNKQWESQHGLYRRLPEVLICKSRIKYYIWSKEKQNKNKKQNKKAVNCYRMLLTTYSQNEHIKTHDGNCIKLRIVLFTCQITQNKNISIAFSIVWTIKKMAGRRKDTGKCKKHDMKEIWRCIFRQPSYPCFWKFTFGLNHGSSSASRIHHYMKHYRQNIPEAWRLWISWDFWINDQLITLKFDKNIQVLSYRHAYNCFREK